MPNIREITTWSLAAALLMAAPSGASAGNQNPNYGGYDKPDGSYKTSCNSQTYHAEMVAISAMCRKKSGSWVKTSIAYHRCFTGTIRNDDGTLRCDLDPGTDAQDKALRDAATPALDSASIVVFGAGMTPMYDIYMFHLRRDGSPYIEDIGARSLQFSQAATFLRGELLAAGKASWDQVIVRAFQQAKKRAPTAAELTKYEGQIAAGKAWYTTIVLAEKTN